MKMRRVLTAFLAVLMLVSLVPAAAFAAGGSGDGKPAEEQGKLILDKEATLTDDGSYTINMEAFATGKTTIQKNTTGVPLDIVLVLDQSGSMGENKLDGETYQKKLKTEVEKFINRVVENGKTAGVTHRMAMVGFASGPLEGTTQGTNWNWLSTGVFDNKGDFIKYQDAEKGVSKTYELYEGELAQGNAYYVKLTDGSFVPLTYTEGAVKYVKVKNPDTSKKNYYYGSKAGGDFANYGEYITNVEAKNPVKGDGKTYYDAQGNQLTWVEEKVTEQEYVKVDKPVQGTNYYIDLNNNPNNRNWVQLTSSGKYWYNGWDRYVVNTKNQLEKIYVGGGLTGDAHDAYELKTIETPTGNWFLSTDGKTPVTPVYEKVTTTGWHVGNTAVSTVYEKKTGGAAWQYNDGSNIVTRTNEPVYVAAEKSVYASALVPVTVGEKGQGDTTPSLIKSKDAIAADGATRPSFGIEMANKIFAANPIEQYNPETQQGRRRVMIVFTDGEPGYNGNDDVEAYKAISNSYETKHTHNATVYSIGLYNANKVTDFVKNFLGRISSDCPNANYKYVSRNAPTTSTDYAIVRLEGDDALAKKDGSIKFRRNASTSETTWKSISSEFPDAKPEYFEYDAKHLTGGTIPKTPKYSKAVTNAADLADIFETIYEEIGGSTTNVDLTTDSILRDIMAEGFALTNKSVVTVSVVPGDATNAADETQIKWGTPVKVLTLTNPTDGKAVTDTYPDSTGKDMTIKASTHMKNPESGKKNLHTVDVTGFDYKDQYIAQAHKGSKLVVEITGVKALPTVTTDKNIFTNHEQSGIWAPVTEGGERQLKAPFPKRPKTYMPSKNYVVDYAKPLDLAAADFKMNKAVNVDVDGYDPFASANTKIDHKYGDVSVAGGKVTYTPTTMNWDGYDTFYVFGTTQNATVKAASANANGNVWSKVQVIPANNVYYEDTFVTNTTDGTVGITYTGTWDAVQTGPNTTAPEDNNNPDDNHGWIPVLKDETGDTDGTSHHASAANGNKATATFTFTGTGVDVYSRTNGQTGTIIAMLTDSNGNKQMKRVDTLSASGEYYQIPTLTFSNLTYGEYTVELRVTSAADPASRYEYYLDGIRVYNPIQTGDPVVDEAYGKDELNAKFIEVRDILLDANSFSAEKNTSTGPVFIDQIKEGQGTDVGTGTTTTVVGTYKDYGPKNEVYLKCENRKGQMISFKVKNIPGYHYYVGMKSPTGTSVMVGYPGVDGNKQTVNMKHTADMYYEVGPASNGVISIENMMGDVLSITKLKVTNENGEVVLNDIFEETPVPMLLSAAQDFSNQPVNPDPDVDIENPDVPGGDQKPEKPHIIEVIHKIFEEIRGWFGR